MRLLTLILLLAVPAFTVRAQRVSISSVNLGRADRFFVQPENLRPAPAKTPAFVVSEIARPVLSLRVMRPRIEAVNLARLPALTAFRLDVPVRVLADDPPDLFSLNGEAMEAIRAFGNIDPRYPDIDPISHYGQQVFGVKQRVEVEGWTPENIAQWKLIYAAAARDLRAVIEQERIENNNP